MIRRLGGGADRASLLVAVAVVLQLATSARFLAKYSPVSPAASYLLLVAGGGLIALAALRSRRVVAVLGSRWLLWSALAVLALTLLVVYPRADGLRAVGRGSDQDDCVRMLVDHVLAGRPPYSLSYLGHPCSTGPAELLPYLPVALSRYWFALVPSLALALGYWVLTHVVERRWARILVLSQLTSLLFLELAATGSDFILVGWLFAAAVVLTRRGLQEGRAGLTAAGVGAYVLFAGSRVPLALTVIGSLVTLLVIWRSRRALGVSAVVLAGTALAYGAVIAAEPSGFAPDHTLGKAGEFLSGLGGPATAGLAVVAAGSAAFVVLPAFGRLAGRYHLEVNALLVLLPMAVAGAGELAVKHGSIAGWEGLNYLLVAVPALLVALGSRVAVPRPRAESVRATVLGWQPGNTPPSSRPTTPSPSVPA